MTDTATPAEPLDYGGMIRRCPTNNPVGRLTVNELDIISRLLKTNAAAAAAKLDHPQHMSALAHVAWIYERRTVPTAPLAAYLELEADQVYALTGLLDPDDDDAVEELAENPSTSTPA